MSEQKIVRQHLRNVSAFEAAGATSSTSAQEPYSESSTMKHGEDDQYDFPASSSEATPPLVRNRTMSTVSMRTEDFDLLVRRLSRRTTGVHSQDQDHEAELAEIMGGIFGRSDEDMSKRKHVGVIWKHLTVSLSTCHAN